MQVPVRAVLISSSGWYSYGKGWAHCLRMLHPVLLCFLPGSHIGAQVSRSCGMTSCTEPTTAGRWSSEAGKHLLLALQCQNRASAAKTTSLPAICT